MGGGRRPEECGRCLWDPSVVNRGQEISPLEQWIVLSLVYNDENFTQETIVVLFVKDDSIV